MRRCAIALIFGALLVAGCYETPQPVCAFLCGTGDACPDGYDCAPDGFCKRNDVDPNMQCPGVDIAIDASDVDAPAADADTTDADPGAPDADTTDAAIPDANISDADTTDADTTDADTTDAT